MWTLFNKSGRVNTSYWQIHEAFTSKTPHPLFFPHILFISPAETWVCPVRKLRSLGGKYMALGKEETVFQTKGTGKMASNWDHERRETLHREMYQSKLMLKISDPQHYPFQCQCLQLNKLFCFVFLWWFKLDLPAQLQVFCSRMHKMQKSRTTCSFVLITLGWTRPLFPHWWTVSHQTLIRLQQPQSFIDKERQRRTLSLILPVQSTCALCTFSSFIVNGWGRFM